MEECKDSPETCSLNDRKVPRWLALEELERDRTRVSVNKDRVKSITQKLSKLQQGLEVDKSRSRSALEGRLADLETKLKRQEDEQENRLEECDQQIEQLMEALGQERLARELLDERKTKESEVMIKSIDLKLENLKDAYTKTESSHSEELVKIREQLETEKVLRAKAEEQFGVQLCDQVAKLTEQVEAYREQNAALIERVLQLESAQKVSKEGLAGETRARNDLEAHVVNMLEDLCAKMRTEIVAERADREAMEETLLKLIEETCSRVEGGLISSS
mmetsp:Transcript_43376/g.69440  ORF Transcript_43376/g.69440 Transcript_43376/m.69440 type:complete len:276 (-) Transcript_43376:1174-2001(-)